MLQLPYLMQSVRLSLASPFDRHCFTGGIQTSHSTGVPEPNAKDS